MWTGKRDVLTETCATTFADPTALETLLPKHAGFDFRGGQQRS